MSNVRMTYKEMPKEVYNAMLGLEEVVNSFGLDKILLELIKVRASQMNGCAFCIDMHYKDAIKAGEEPQRLYSLIAWRETSYYSPKERALLAWTEALTFVADGHVSDDVYEEMSKHFSKEEIGQINLVIIAINGWNRLVLAIRSEPGSYKG